MPRKNKRNADYWNDLDGRLTLADKLASEFFSDTKAISVEETPPSQLELSDEEKTADAVEVRFDGDGFAYEKEISSEVENEHLLDPMPLPGKMGLTQWGSDFAEVHARVQEFSIVSKLSAIRYVTRGDSIKVSSLPSAVDYLADVCITARRALTPAGLYRVWHEIYYIGFGKDADRVRETVQIAIQQRCGSAWKKVGLLPFGRYWSTRVKMENVRAMSFPVARDLRGERNARRQARRAAAKITTLAVAA